MGTSCRWQDVKRNPPVSRADEIHACGVDDICTCGADDILPCGQDLASLAEEPLIT